MSQFPVLPTEPVTSALETSLHLTFIVRLYNSSSSNSTAPNLKVHKFRMLSRMVHTKCRTTLYPLSEIKRFLLTDDQVPWNVPFENYNPPDYDSPALHNKPWADPPCDPNFAPKWNELDGKINRTSHTGPYLIQDGRPLNPEGRTGLKGRGLLGKWGPNHAADPVVTRWKRKERGAQEVHSVSELPILQFCAIQRRDCGQWAIPGGMVDPGEKVSETLKREFLEEAFNSLETDVPNEEIISKFFETGDEIFRGYVDDPRNTDNAWMETIAVNFHDETNETVGQFKLQAGDDAKNVKWIDIDKSLDLYASHARFVEQVAKSRQAHW